MPNVAALSPGEHAVHFYRGEIDLVAGVLLDLLAGLRAGEPILVIAVPDHRTALETALLAQDVDLAAAESARLLTWLDAGAMADRLLIDGSISAAAFDESVGSLVRRAGGDGATVHAYGEIVAVLWARGEIVAAIELEQLWNELLRQQPISLMCGYPVELLTSDASLSGFPAVCAEHTRLLGGAPVAAPAEASRRFPRAPAAIRHARGFVTDTLRGWGRGDLADAAALLATELATNAVIHAASDFSVSVLRRADAVRVAVGDADPAPPRARAGRIDEPHGRGLLVVDAMSVRWGHEAAGDGKVVWAELAGTSGTDPR